MLSSNYSVADNNALISIKASLMIFMSLEKDFPIFFSFFFDFIIFVIAFMMMFCCLYDVAWLCCYHETETPHSTCALRNSVLSVHVEYIENGKCRCRCAHRNALFSAGTGQMCKTKRSERAKSRFPFAYTDRENVFNVFS